MIQVHTKQHIERCCSDTSIKTRIETFKRPTNYPAIAALVAVILPLKQGLKLKKHNIYFEVQYCCSDTSIKTRIETPLFFLVFQQLLIVAVILPLKQGLKLNILIILFPKISCCSDTSIKTRIETHISEKQAPISIVLQ